MSSLDNEERRALNCNLAQFQIDTIRTYGDSVAMIETKTGASYRFSELIPRIYRLAAGLRDVGLRQGDVLAILTFNHIEFHVIWYATNLLGAIFQPLSPTYTDDDIFRRFEECQTKFLVTSPELAKRMNSKLRFLKSSKPHLVSTVIVMGLGGDGYIPYNSLFSDRTWTEAAPVDPSRDTAIFLSSSGTTGLPKHVRLTHRNIAFNIVQWSEIHQLKPGTCQLLCLPMFHHYGGHCVGGGGLYQGLKTVVMERFGLKFMADIIPKYQVNILPVVPPMANRIVKYLDASRADLSSVKHIMCAAAPLGIEVEIQLKKLFKLNYIARVYGLTETGFNTGNNDKYNKPGSCGKFPRSIGIKIVDPEMEQTLPANKTGEIRINGHQITAGYLNREDADRNASDKDGYFKTGDLGYLDSDGFLFVVDRLKELIKYNAFQVAPAYLEDLLMKHPDVADAAVIGIPDSDAGELPKAFIVRQPKTHVTSQEISKYVEARVASYMRLRGGVQFIDAVPRSPSGKILRRLLRDQGAKTKL